MWRHAVGRSPMNIFVHYPVTKECLTQRGVKFIFSHFNSCFLANIMPTDMSIHIAATYEIKVLRLLHTLHGKHINEC